MSGPDPEPQDGQGTPPDAAANPTATSARSRGTAPAGAAPPEGQQTHDGEGDGSERRKGLLGSLRERHGRLHDQRLVHRKRSKIVRAAWLVGAALLIVAGIILSGPGIPGPGFLVIAFGLFMLALEFDWADRLLGRALDYSERASDRAGDASSLQKGLAAALVVAAIAGYVVAAYLWEIPFLPG